MMMHRIATTGFLFLALFSLLLGCGSGSEAVDTAGLSQITLRIEGMT